MPTASVESSAAALGNYLAGIAEILFMVIFESTSSLIVRVGIKNQAGIECGRG